MDVQHSSRHSSTAHTARIILRPWMNMGELGKTGGIQSEMIGFIRVD